MEVDFIITQSLWLPTWLFLKKSLLLWTLKNMKKLSVNKNPLLLLFFMEANYIKFIKNAEGVILVLLFSMWINHLYR